MNLTALKTWVSGETLTATDLNAEFQNIYTHTITNSDIDSTGTYVLGELVVGSGITAADGGQFHVHTASAGSVQAHADANEAVLENSAASGLSILSGSSSDGNIFFGDAADNDVGKIAYSHSANSLAFTTNGATALTLSSAQAATFAGDVSVGGALTLTGGLTLNGAVVVGDSASDTLTVNATVTSDLLFTDATYDIGKSGATRPRDGFFSRNMAVGGTLGVTGLITATGGVSGALTGNVTGNVTGDVTGDLTGNVTGNVTGNLTGDVTGNISGNVTGGTISGTTGTFSGATTVGSAGATADFAVWTDGTSSTAAGFTVDASADEVIVGQLSGGGNTTFKVRNRLNNTVFSVTPDAPSTTVFAPNIATGSAGTLTVKTGSINSDSIRFEAGGTTSTWLESRGYLGHSWYVDSTRSMTLDSTGLGIGTTSPSSLLHLYKSGALAELKIEANGVANPRLTLHNNLTYHSQITYTNDLQIYGSGGSTLHLVLDSSGNVGINESTPSTLLHVTEGGEPPAEGMLILEANSSSRQLRIQPPTNADNGFFDARGGNMTFLDDGTEIFRYNASTISTSSGIKVGIGTSSPSAALSVQYNPATTNGFELIDSRDTNDRVGFLASGGGLGIYTSTNGSYSSSNAAITVDTSQRVGIGTVSPSAKFVVSDGGNTGLEVNPSHSNSRVDLFSYDRSASAYRDLRIDGDELIFRTGSSPTERARILSSGGITFNGDTAAANALDDYEEGTHNPSVGCSTSGSMGLNSSRNTLQYTKIGNWVNVQGYVEINSVSSGVGHVTLSMPFANQNDSEYSGVSMGSIIVSASSNPLNCDRYALYMQQGSSSVSIYATDGSTLQNDSAENITTAGGADLYLNISFRTQ